MSNQSKGFLFIVTAASLWGLSGTVAKLLTNQAVNPFVLVEIRLMSSALLLGIFLAISRRDLLVIDRRDIGYFIRLGIFGIGGVQYAYFFTISQTNVATAVFLQYISPVLVALYAVIFQKERLCTKQISALLLAIGGSYLMVFSRGLAVTPIGLVSGLASAVFLSTYTIYSKRGLRVYSPWTIMFYCFIVGAVMGAFIVPPWRFPAETFSTGNLFFFGYIAILGTIVPFGCFFNGLRWLKPTKAGITATMEPVVAALSAFIILNERLSYAQVTGAGCVLLAVILLQFKRQSHLTEQPAK
ncbi:MAG TPA: DMT family transporter [Desulfobacteria bacterium]|nr:DMT family transporter [Desulfobacteria bacterium]